MFHRRLCDRHDNRHCEKQLQPPPPPASCCCVQGGVTVMATNAGLLMQPTKQSKNPALSERSDVTTWLCSVEVHPCQKETATLSPAASCAATLVLFWLRRFVRVRIHSKEQSEVYFVLWYLLSEMCCKNIFLYSVMLKYPYQVPHFWSFLVYLYARFPRGLEVERVKCLNFNAVCSRFEKCLAA